MINHVGIRPRSMESSRAFYDAALKPLGITKMMEVKPEEAAGYHSIGFGSHGKPIFWISNSRHAASSSGWGDGIHIAFEADTRAGVDAFFAAAIAHGGRDNGPPGIRSHYHATYYAAFVIDPDGFNIEAVCQRAE